MRAESPRRAGSRGHDTEIRRDPRLSGGIRGLLPGVLRLFRHEQATRSHRLRNHGAAAPGHAAQGGQALRAHAPGGGSDREGLRGQPHRGGRHPPPCRSHQRLRHRRQDRKIGRHDTGTQSSGRAPAVDGGPGRGQGREDRHQGLAPLAQELRGRAHRDARDRGIHPQAGREPAGLDGRSAPEGAAPSRHGQYQLQVRRRQPHRHGLGQGRHRRLGASRVGREARGSPPRCEGPRAGAAQSRPDGEDPQAAGHGPGSVLHSSPGLHRSGPPSPSRRGCPGTSRSGPSRFRRRRAGSATGSRACGASSSFRSSARWTTR